MLARLVMVTATASLVLLFGMPQIALACHQGDPRIPHGNQTTCDGGGAPGGGVIQFVGFTDDVANALPDTINGGQGFMSMHALCRDDFGPEARMCTTEEFWRSPTTEAPADTNSWLHSVGDGQNDFTGISKVTCSGWTSPSLNAAGMVVKPDGKLSTSVADGRCDVVRPVTCCAPAQ